MRDRQVQVHVPVEPLSDAKWGRVARGVFAAVQADTVTASPREARFGPHQRDLASRETSRLRPILAFGSLLVAAALVLIVGRTWLGRSHVDFTRISTSAGASRVVVGESSLEVEPESSLLVRGDDEHGVGVVVDRGSVTCEVAPRHGRPPFVVDAGDVRVRVIGTRFTVAREGTETHVRVDHGTVEVTSRGVVTLLHDGESWPSQRAAQLTTPESVAPAPDSVVPPTPPPAEPGTRPLHSPHVRTRVRHEKALRPTSPPHSSAETVPRSSVEVAPPADSSPAPAPAPHRGETPEELFETATGLERAQPARAEAIYRQLAAGPSSWAANALFALARLRADRGDRAEACALLDRYLGRYPHGTNAADARELRGRLR